VTDRNETPGPARAVARPASGSRLDSFADSYAARTRGMLASEIRALFAVASRPEVVSLAGGMPNIAGLPLDAVGEVLDKVLSDRGEVALQYGSGQGDPKLREQICEVMALEGIRANADDVVVTVGSQHGLDLVTRIFCDPGDVVLAEAPSYVGALSVFRSYQAQVVHVAMDDEGLRPDDLRAAIGKLERGLRRPKLLYTVPNFHNPAGVTLANQRRAEILEICRSAGVIVIEDNPYGLLGFDADPLPALRSLDDGVIYLGSFSKTFAPGFRVGWVTAPHGVREKLVLAAEASVLCPPAFSQLAVSTYLATQPWRQQIKSFQEMYRERRDAMLDALDAMFPPDAVWTRPAGGFYVWATMPDGVDTKAMLPRAVTDRVAYVPGTAFYADGFGSRSLRLSYCYPTPERIREGVRRLADVLAAELDLLETFGAIEGTGPLRVGQRPQGPAPDTA
jgi:DNA-binding transcriptional MocR family regulator